MAIARPLGSQVLMMLFLLGGCHGTHMLKKGDQALEFSSRGDHSIPGLDGAAVNLMKLRAQGPVMVVFLRGFG